MKIVLLNDDYPPSARGGAGMVAANLAIGLKESGHQVFVITTVRDEASAGETEIDGVRVYRLRAGYHDRWRAYLSLRNPQTTGRVEKILVDVKPDVVHAHNIHHYLSYHCLKLAKRSGAKVFLTAHDVMLFHYGKLTEFIDPAKPVCLPHPDYRVTPWQQIRTYKKYYNPFRNLVIRQYLKYLDGMFAVSEALKEALRQNGIGGAEVMHNGIDVDRWRSHQEEVETFIDMHGLHGRKVVLCSGRMNAAKGLDQLLEAMQLVKREVPEAILVVGGGKEFGLRPEAPADDAVFTEWMAPDQMCTAIHASAVVTVPSICFDSFPTATLEAMACGKPVVTSCLGGSKEAVRDGLTGFVIDPFDIETMARKLVVLLKDPALAERMGTAGFERVSQAFSLKRQVEQTLHRYRSASGDKSTN